MIDLSWLSSWLDSTNTFFQAIWEFMNNGIYQFFKDSMVVLVKGMIYAYIQAKVYMLEIAYTVVKEILQETGVVALVKSA